MKREEAIRIAMGLRTDFKCESDTMVDFCNTIIKALEQEPCDDAISKQAVLEQTYSWCRDEFLRTTNPFDYLRKRINSLPPVTSTSSKMEQVEQEPFINKPCVSNGVCEHDKNNVLDKIRAEIDRQEKWLLQAGYIAYNVDIAFDAIKAVLAESEGKK